MNQTSTSKFNNRNEQEEKSQTPFDKYLKNKENKIK